MTALKSCGHCGGAILTGITGYGGPICMCQRQWTAEQKENIQVPDKYGSAENFSRYLVNQIDSLEKENAELKQQLAVIENTLDQERRNYKTAVKGFATACELHGAQLAEAQKQNERGNAALAAIEYANRLYIQSPKQFLMEWAVSDWAVIRERWPDAPEAIFPKEKN